MIAAAIGADRLAAWIAPPRLRQAVVAAAAIGLLLFSAAGARRFVWGDLDYRSKFIDRRQPAWTVMRAHIRAYRYLAQRPDLHGLQDSVDNLLWSPGYYYLHQNVPVIFSLPPGKGAPISRPANYLISRALIAGPGLAKIARIEDIYIYRKNDHR